MFQGPKGYIAQICEVHLQYGNSTTKWPFTLFLVNSTLIYILFSLPMIPPIEDINKADGNWHII